MVLSRIGRLIPSRRIGGSFRLRGGCCLVVMAVLGLGSPTAEAIPIPVPNYSFELPDRADGAGSSTNTNGSTATVPGWTYSHSSPTFGGTFNHQNAQYAGTTDADGGTLPSPGVGEQTLFINFSNGMVAGQTASFTTTNSLATIEAKSVYTLTVAIGDRLDILDPQRVRIELLAGTTTVASATHDGGFVDGTFTDMVASFATDETSIYLGQPLKIRLTHTLTSNATGNVQANFDNVRLNQAVVPEPSTALLLGLGGVSLLVWGRRRRRV